jgi:Co/Zn/Cd efflux system component
MVAICLSDGPQTVAEIEQRFIEIPRRFGLFIELVDTEPVERGDLTEDLLVDLKRMEEAGLIVRGGDVYSLTPLGKGRAATRLEGLQKAGKLARGLLRPQTVAKVSLGVHLVLALVKLPAGLLSGSVGLINDGADTLLDGLASLLVFGGLRLGRERAVNVVLVLLMLGTGGLTLFEAVQRFFVPVEPEADWFAFLASVASALVCLGLWAYQRYVGVRSGSVALITQSVDSRNHVIVALGVTAGLVASLLRFGLLDTLVGLAVAGLILVSAVELAVETVRSLRGGNVDLSAYSVGLVERYGRFREAQMRDWMLYLVARQGVRTRSELRSRARSSLDFSHNPALRGVGLGGDPEAGERVDRAIDELFARAWIEEDGQLRVTDLGRARLSRAMHRGHRH